MFKQIYEIYKKTLLGEGSHIADNDSNDDSVNTEGRSKNLSDQHLGEQTTILSIGQSATRSANTHRKSMLSENPNLLLPASHVGQTDTKSSAEHSVGSEVESTEIEIRLPVEILIISVG